MKNPSVLSDAGPRGSFSSSTSAPCVAGQWQWCKARNIGVSPPSVCLFSAAAPCSPASFPLLLLFVAALAACIPMPVVGRVVEKHLV